MHGFLPRVTVLSWLAVAAAMTGCARDRVGESKAEKAAGESTVGAVAPRAVVMAHGADGSAAAWEQLIADAAGADVVLIGETHGHPVGLASAAALWQDVLGRDQQAALALEFFERDEQPHIDDYLAGLTDEKTFRESTRRTAGSYPAGHAAMLEAAKAAKRPVIASNAPRVYVRTARKDGYEKLAALSEEQRRLFRIPDELPTGRYREEFDKVMSGMSSHEAAAGGGASGAAKGGSAAGSAAKATGGSSSSAPAAEETAEQRKARLDASFRSQSLWDWTMADSIVRAVETGPASGPRAASRPVVQVVGRFHVEFDGGLAQAIRKIRPGTRIVSVVYVDEDAGAMKEDERGRADYVVYVGALKEEKKP